MMTMMMVSQLPNKPLGVGTCDTKRGGRTSTSFAALFYPSRHLYGTTTLPTPNDGHADTSEDDKRSLSLTSAVGDNFVLAKRRKKKEETEFCAQYFLPYRSFFYELIRQIDPHHRLLFSIKLEK